VFHAERGWWRANLVREIGDNRSKGLQVQLGDHSGQFAFALVPYETAAQGLGAGSYMMREALFNSHPDAVWREGQGAMIAEGGGDGIDQRMDSADGAIRLGQLRSGLVG
jgi:hypothetical protein